MKLFFLLAVLILSPAPGTPVVAQQPNSSSISSESVDSDADLRRAIESSSGNETQIISNLEDYLKKYPKSARRAEIEGEIYKLSLKLRDRDRAIAYAEKLITKDPENIDPLSTIVTVLRERRAEGDLKKALVYANQLVGQVEKILSNNSKPKRISAAQWLDRKERGIASVYLLRGKVLVDLDDDEKAQADLVKSYKSARLAGAAITLAELAERRKNNEEAIDYYLQAFVIALDTEESIDLKAVRSKLAKLYTVRHGSETGLGDRLLKVYDSYTKDRDERIARLETPNINNGVTDPLSFKLTRLDGSTLEMNSLRGKVLVINFWATWCGPCLTELPLFEKTIEKYKGDKDVVFLAITTDEDRDLVQPFLKQHKFNLPVAYADYLNEKLAISSIPTTIVIDRAGQTSFRQAGYNPREDFIAMLSEKIETAKKR